MPDLDLKPSEFRRVQRYHPLFFTLGPVLAVALFLLAFWASGWNYRLAFGFGFPALGLGAILGIKFRDVP